MTKREEYIINVLHVASEIAFLISEIGRVAGTHKYDIWIAKEYKKQNEILRRKEVITFILDWVKAERIAIFEYNFENALKEAVDWHRQFENDKKNTKIGEDIDSKERILYHCKDNKHFFLLLMPDELEAEGTMMKNCVSTYESKVKNLKSFIVSLRDEHNEPHVTMEFDAPHGDLIQIRGKANTNVNKKYLTFIIEFAAIIAGEENIDDEISEFVNLKLKQ